MFDWSHFLTYIVITAITPGPNNIMSMSNASRVGLRRGLSFNLGIFMGFATVMILCTALSSALSAVIPKIQFPMLIIGALYMLHLAYKTWNSSGDFNDTTVRTGCLSGFLLQFVNAKIYIYCILSMQIYILPVFGTQPLILLGFALLLAVTGSACNILWAAFGSMFRLLFSKYATITNRIMALALVYCAVGLFL